MFNISYHHVYYLFWSAENVSGISLDLVLKEVLITFVTSSDVIISTNLIILTTISTIITTIFIKLKILKV